MSRARAIAALLWAASTSAAALPSFAHVDPSPAALVERPGAVLPLQLEFTDADGRAAPLARQVHDKPVLLLLGYYRCPQLCGLLMHDLLDTLQRAQVPQRDVRLVGISIDPEDTPATARAREAVDLAYAARRASGRAAGLPPDLHLLVGRPAAVAEVARRVGFDYRRTPSGETAARFDHPATVIVLTPEGRVSRYLMGPGLDPQALATAIHDAAQGHIGTLGDRIALLCAHVDLAFGRHSAAAMAAARAAGLLTLGALLCGAWRWRRGARR